MNNLEYRHCRRPRCGSLDIYESNSRATLATPARLTVIRSIRIDYLLSSRTGFLKFYFDRVGIFADLDATEKDERFYRLRDAYDRRFEAGDDGGTKATIVTTSGGRGRRVCSFQYRCSSAS